MVISKKDNRSQVQATVYVNGCTQAHKEVTDQNSITGNNLLCILCDSAAWFMSGIELLIGNLNCKLQGVQESGSLDPMQMSIAYEID